MVGRVRPSLSFLFAGMVFMTILGPLAADPELGFLKRLREQNERRAESIKVEADKTVAAAEELAKTDPEKALEQVRDWYFRVTDDLRIPAAERHKLNALLREKLFEMHEAVARKNDAEIRASYAIFTEFALRQADALAAIHRPVPKYVSSTPGPAVWVPAGFRFASGVDATGFIHAINEGDVFCTIDGTTARLPSRDIVGIETGQGFFLYHPARHRYFFFSNPELFALLVAFSPATQHAAYWRPYHQADTPDLSLRRSDRQFDARLLDMAVRFWTYGAAKDYSADDRVLTVRLSRNGLAASKDVLRPRVWDGSPLRRIIRDQTSRRQLRVLLGNKVSDTTLDRAHAIFLRWLTTNEGPEYAPDEQSVRLARLLFEGTRTLTAAQAAAAAEYLVRFTREGYVGFADRAAPSP
jgi:hypothetical protein